MPATAPTAIRAMAQSHGDGHEACEADEDPGQHAFGQASQRQHTALRADERAHDEETRSGERDLAADAVGGRTGDGGQHDGGERGGRSPALAHAEHAHERGNDHQSPAHAEQAGQEPGAHSRGQNQTGPAHGAASGGG